VNLTLANLPELECEGPSLVIWDGARGWEVQYPNVRMADHALQFLAQKIYDIETSIRPKEILGKWMGNHNELINKFLDVCKSSGMPIVNVSRRGQG
jgi:hypothetical protein